MSNISINIDQKDLFIAFDRVRDSVKTREVNKVLKLAAKPIRKAARTLAPVGPTGNLKRSIKTKTLKGGAVTVRPDFKIAPHAHLVVSGTGERFRRRVVFRPGGVQIAVSGGVYTGVMPANDFMAQAERLTGSRAQQVMADGLWELIKRASG